jgi:hypothetical protein
MLFKQAEFLLVLNIDPNQVPCTTILTMRIHTHEPQLSPTAQHLPSAVTVTMVQ